MNGDVGGGVVIKPDQMQIVNPLLILLMVPLFESFIYPLFKRCGLLTPLQRIGSGLVLCGLSFIVSAFVEIALEVTDCILNLENKYSYFFYKSRRTPGFQGQARCG